jgi:hypothetical protein
MGTMREKINGRKRHLFVDVMGMVLAVGMHRRISRIATGPNGCRIKPSPRCLIFGYFFIIVWSTNMIISKKSKQMAD